MMHQASFAEANLPNLRANASTIEAPPWTEKKNAGRRTVPRSELFPESAYWPSR